MQNLVVFAPLILVAHLADVHSPLTEWSARIYFGARVAHAVAYTFAVPWVRTIAFNVGWAAMAAVGFAVLV